MSSLLSVTALRSGYAGSVVVHGVDLELGQGEVVGLLGRNGVGKTTFVSTTMGLLRPYSGSVRLLGQELAGRPAEVVARAGAGLVPQGRRVFAPLTVEEHLDIAGRRGRPGHWTRRRVLELLPQLAARLGHRGDELSGGEQQMLAIARALLPNPRALLLDEPSDGLAPGVVAEVTDVVKSMRETGMSVLLVEQDLRLAFSVSDRIAVMEKGQKVLDTTTADFRADPDRARQLLGVS